MLKAHYHADLRHPAAAAAAAGGGRGGAS